jgi:serine/threonine protein phosphatase PrpC
MKLRFGAATLAKRGNSPDENEDAFAPPVTEGLQSLPFNCAVADGATETSYSGLWAKMLSEHFCSLEQPDQFQSQLPQLRERWKSTTGSKPLPWYAEQKLEKGAFATLIGVRITEAEFQHSKWQAISVGDSVLFHVRESKPYAKFPMMSSEDFKNRPMLLSTNVATEESEKSLYQSAEGILEVGDWLILASDKIAEWIIREIENEMKPFDLIQQMARTENSFPQLIESLTQRNEIKNDDYTLLWVEACGGGI